MLESEVNQEVIHFPKHRLTVAVDRNIHPLSTWTFIALAVAGPRDHWSRKMGKLIALNRLNSKKGHIRGRYIVSPPILDAKGHIDWAQFLPAVHAELLERLKSKGALAEFDTLFSTLSFVVEEEKNKAAFNRQPDFAFPSQQSQPIP